MKRILLSGILMIIGLSTFAQHIDLRRKINVSGVAEMEITPDIIYVGISLKEYFNGNKKAVSIVDIEKQLLKALKKAGVPQENLFINNLSSYHHSLEQKKNPGFAASKQYRLKLSDPSVFNAIIVELDPKTVVSTHIEGYDHSKITEYRKEVRINALKSAREKAGYLAETLNDEVGEVINIQEVNHDYPGLVPMYSNMTIRASAEDDSASIEFKKIKITSEMNVVFELKN